MNARTTISASYMHQESTSDSPSGLGVNTVTPSWSVSANWSNGTGAKQINVAWHDKRTLSYGASETLDLAGSLTGAWANTVTFDAVKALLIQNLDAAESLTVGPAASNGWSTLLADTVTVRPQAWFIVACGDSDTTGYTVTAGTGDQITVTAGGSGSGSLDYYIALVGIDT